ncbi:MULTISPECIES: LPXTG cell wall anchor domain-containing protein, partial [unclassified Streptococcus]
PEPKPEPNPEPNPEKSNSIQPESKKSEEKLPNTGTEKNTNVSTMGLLAMVTGLALGLFKKKEESE